jgi:antitoxin ParD1/3/4
MSVTLSHDVEELIIEWVESGNYADADAVVLDALKLLEERQLQELRAAIQIGIDELERGEGVDFTPEWSEEMLRRVRAAAGEKNHPVAGA